MNNRIRVVCRKRPLNRRESSCRYTDVVSCIDDAVLIREPKVKVDLTRYTEEHTFQFDGSFDDDATNENIYDSCVSPLIDGFIQDSAKCTCFCFGQTGSGKTYVFIVHFRNRSCRFTMLGANPTSSDGHLPGIFPIALADLFSRLKCIKCPEPDSSIVVVTSFFEIYCGKLYDLLNGRKHLHARENSHGRVIIQGIREIEADSASSLMSQISIGLNSRTTGVTGANIDSSRSHAIISISLKLRNDISGRQTSFGGGKLSFIDLAGSERAADTLDQDKQTRIDGAEINKSLLALKECIRALDQQLDHTPFRGSKLTQVLKDSFVGQNCMTLMIANISPSSGSVEHTLNTLRYAYRVKELKGSVVPRRIIPTAWRSTSVVRTPAAAMVRGESSTPEDSPISVPTSSEASSSRESSIDMDDLAREHDTLIGQILLDEEALIASHKESLRRLAVMLTDEAKQVDLIDRPGSDVDAYVAYLDENLFEKETIVRELRTKLDAFKDQLNREEKLSRMFQDKTNKLNSEIMG